MKNKICLLIMLIMFIFCMFSCPTAMTTVKFMAYDQDSGKYIELEDFQTVVKSGTLFRDITNRPTSDNVPHVEDEESGLVFIFENWSNTTPHCTPEGDEELIVLQPAKPEDKALDCAEVKVYCSYFTSSAMMDVKLYAFNRTGAEEGSYQEILNTTVPFGTHLSSVVDGTTVNPVKNYYNHNFNFKWWTNERPDDLNDISVTGEEFPLTKAITENVNFYVRYDAFYKLKFMQYDSLSGTYAQVGDVKEVLQDTVFGDVTDRPTIDNRQFGGTVFTHYGWTKLNSSTEMLEEYNTTAFKDEEVIKEDITLLSTYQGDYLCFTAVENSEVSFDILGTLSYGISLQYRKSTENVFTDYKWSGSTSGTTGNGDKISLAAGQSVYFKGNNATFSQQIDKGVRFQFTGNIKASGCIMSIVNNRDEIPTAWFFHALFALPGDFDSDITLPATTLKPFCYRALFANTGITSSPALPATTLADGCYYAMFGDCSKLTEAPALPATTLANSCYQLMFNNCTSLYNIDKLSELPASVVPGYAYSQMFMNTAITECPNIKARELQDEYACNQMFRECVLLRKIAKFENPISHVSKLISIANSNSFTQMYMYCIHLEDAQYEDGSEIVFNNVGFYSLRNMFEGCINLTSSPKIKVNSFADSTTGQFNNMFNGCFKLENVYINLPSYEYYRHLSWLNKVSSSGTVYTNITTMSTDSVNGIPTGWTRKDYQ